MSISDFLLNPILAGIASILGIISFVVGLFVAITKFRKWLLQHPNTKWIVKIPWALILIVIGIAMGISVGIRNQNTYQGLSIASVITAVGLGIQGLQNSLLLSRFRETYDQLTHSYNNLLKVIDRLQDAEFTLSDWSISHTVYENGNGALKEEVTIIPVSEPVIYYYVRYSVSHNSDREEIKLSVVNASDDTPLDCYEVSTTENSVKYMIVLDPPSIISAPMRISITCERVRVWSDLIKHGRSEGSLNAKYKADSIRIELFAPRASKWKALRPAPSIGDVKIDMVGNLSRATWKITSPSIRKYNYRVFLDGIGTKDLL